MKAGVIFVVVLMLTIAGCKREEPPPPTSRPATQASTKPARKPPTTTFAEIIRAAYPKFPATQPLVVPVDLPDAGHFVLSEPIYICPRGDLWIARPDARPIEEVLGKANDEQVHIIPRPVHFAAWATDDNGKLFARIVVKDDKGNYEWIDGPDRRAATPGRDYRWNDAVFFGNNLIAVPTDRGVSIFTFDPEYSETYHDVLPPSPAPMTAPTTMPTTAPARIPATAPGLAPAANPPQLVVDPSGLIAWSPWDGVKPGGVGAVRFADGKWTDLNAQSSPAWPEKLLHIVPLLDGSVLQLFRTDLASPVKLALAPLGATGADEKAITTLVDQLTDNDPAKRREAFAQLTRYGPPSWPILEKLREDAPPEARVRIEQLLSGKLEPSLGGRHPVDGVMKLAGRFEDGGLLLYLPAGVNIPLEDKPPQLVKPAWITIRPGRAIDMLDPVLSRDADPAKQKFFGFGDEWIVSDNVQGPRRLFGNHLESMLTKKEAAWSYVVGADRPGRWLFRHSPDDSQTLVLDPTLPDPTPKLPVWTIEVAQGTTGWNREDYPVEKSGDPWGLYEHGWRPLDKKTDQMFTEVPPKGTTPTISPAAKKPGGGAGGGAAIQPVAPKPPPTTFATTTTAPATIPTTTATSTTTTAPATTTATTTATTQETLGPPILVDKDGRKYYDGKQRLVVIDPATGKLTDWTLPGTAVGSLADVVLMRTSEGFLFLYNQPGRIVRIKPTPDGPEPFIVEAVFTHRVPQPEKLQRIWLDPAERIVMCYDKHFLAIMFPQGRIPRDIVVLVPAKDLESEDDAK
jgi:hypothetical protein